MIRLSSAFVIIGAAGFMVIGASYAMAYLWGWVVFTAIFTIAGFLVTRGRFSATWAQRRIQMTGQAAPDQSSAALPKSHQPATAIGSHTYAVPRLATGRAMFALFNGGGAPAGKSANCALMLARGCARMPSVPCRIAGLWA
jgi:hypothetical protein